VSMYKCEEVRGWGKQGETKEAEENQGCQYGDCAPKGWARKWHVKMALFGLKCRVLHVKCAYLRLFEPRHEKGVSDSTMRGQKLRR